jgi:hypothetical protein
MRHTLLLVLAALLLAGRPETARAWSWRSVTAEPDSLLLGQPLTLTLEIEVEEGEAPLWPLPAPEQLAGWRLLEADSLAERREDGVRVLARRLVLARFRLGEAPLPVPGPLVDGAPETRDSLRLVVLASLADSVTQKADILAPQALARGWRWWALWLGTLALLAALAAYAWRRWRRRRRPEALAAVVPPDPWSDFLREQARTDELGLWHAGRTEEHFARHSLALRGLLEDCLGLPCRERSTDELRLLLRDSPFSDGDLHELWRLLEENDRVKYARRWPDGAACAALSGRYRAWAERQRDTLAERHDRRLAPGGEARP